MRRRWQTKSFAFQRWQTRHRKKRHLHKPQAMFYHTSNFWLFEISFSQSFYYPLPSQSIIILHNHPYTSIVKHCLYFITFIIPYLLHTSITIFGNQIYNSRLVYNIVFASSRLNIKLHSAAWEQSLCVGRQLKLNIYIL